MSDRDFEIIKKHVLELMKGLAPRLTYHCIDHTLDVIKQSERIAIDEGINEKEIYLLKVAALYHDTGFLEVYKTHEEKSCHFFLRDNNQFHFSDSDKNIILELIMATKVPQHPKTLLQKIICDADLDYLGRSDFDLIAGLLKIEFLNYGIVADEDSWRRLQMKFLENHEYHTASSQLLREPVKKRNFSNLH